MTYEQHRDECGRCKAVDNHRLNISRCEEGKFLLRAEEDREPGVRHIDSLTEWFKAGQRKDAVLTMGEWEAAVREWKHTQ